MGGAIDELARTAPGRLHVRSLDVTDASTIEGLVHEVRTTHGVLDALVNNAAVHYDTWQVASRADPRIVREAVDTNLVGAWLMAVACAPLLVAARNSCLVNVSSGAGALGELRATNPAYGVTKAALNALTLCLAADLTPHGVKVNAVCPGWVATDMGGPGGRPVSQGAEGIVWAATLPPAGPSGGFFRDGQPISWIDG